MQSGTTELQEQIYDLVCGHCTLEGNQIPALAFVKNEFSPGSPCAEGYSRVMEAYCRLCDRLGSPQWDDEDVEIIINELLDIGKHLSLKMFEYGTLYGS